MNQSDVPKGSQPSQDTTADPRGNLPGEPDGTTEPGFPRAGWLATLAACTGLLAGVGAWLIGEAALTAFRPPYERQQVMGQTILKASFQDQSAADCKNAALAFAALGGLLGLALGLAGGLARRNVSSGVKAGVVGLVLGGLLAASASLAIVPVYYRALDRAQEEMSHDLVLPLMVHGGIWSVCGLAGGIAFGIGLGGGRARVLNAALGGLIGAALGAALFEMIGAMAFPAAKTTSPISFTWGSRLFARLLVACLTGLVAAAIVKGPEPSPRAPRPSRD